MSLDLDHLRKLAAVYAVPNPSTPTQQLADMVLRLCDELEIARLPRRAQLQQRLLRSYQALGLEREEP